MDNLNSQQYVTWFRHSSPYINAHRGRTFVLMLGGEAIADANFANIIHDIALLNSLGVRLVIVHGARPQIEARLAEQQLSSSLHSGLRITDAATLACVKDASGSIRAELEAQLSMGLPNSPMHGAKIRVCSGNFVSAKPMGVHQGVDLLHTGQVRKIDGDGIQKILMDGAIVLLSPLGYSPTGEIFNLSLANLAAQAAIALDADKLIAFDAQQGVLGSDKKLRRELQLGEARQILSAHPEQGALQTLILACEAGIERGHLISYCEDGALLQELFTRDGAGTMLSRDSYEQIRSATINDVGGILELIEPLEADGTLVKRSRELLESEIERFAVIERDGTVIACAALYPYDENQAELACIVTHKDYQRGQRAARLLRHLEELAHKQQLAKLFVLTTRTAHWFIEQGFSEQQAEHLPAQKQLMYNYQRNAKVFVKEL